MHQMFSSVSMKTFTMWHDKLYKSVWIKKRKYWKSQFFKALIWNIFVANILCPGGGGFDRDAPRKIKIKPPKGDQCGYGSSFNWLLKGPFLNCQIVLHSAKLPLFKVCEQASCQLTRENLTSLVW